MKTILLIQHTESEHHVNHHIGAQYEWNLTARGRFRFNGSSGSISRYTVEDSGRVTAMYLNAHVD